MAALLVFSCAALFSLALVRYAAAPQWAALAKNNAALAHLKYSISAENGGASIAKRLIDKRDSLGIKFHDLRLEVGETKDLPGVLQMIIAKANAADIQFVKMQPQTETSAGPAAAYPIILEMSASYNSLGRFVSAIEAMPYVIRVDRIAITAQHNELLEIRILVTCFIQNKA